MSEKKSFVLYTDSSEVIDILTDEQAGVLLKSIMKYVKGEPVPEMDAVTKVAFIPIKNHIDRDTEKYNDTCEKRREAGKKGGRPRKSTEEPKKANGLEEKAKKANGFSEKQTKAKKADNDNENDNVNDNDNENDIKKSRKRSVFVPPTLEEVANYCKEKKLSVNPKEFYDYFTEGSWKDSEGKPVKNWKQKLLTWNNHQKKQTKQQTGAPNKFHNFHQRDYDYDQLEKDILKKQW